MQKLEFDHNTASAFRVNIFPAARPEWKKTV
jgi:hypothetical protein